MLVFVLQIINIKEKFCVLQTCLWKQCLYFFIDACHCTLNLQFSQVLSSFVSNIHQTVSEQTGAVKKQWIIHQGKTWITSSLLFLFHRCLYILCNSCKVTNTTDITSNIWKRLFFNCWITCSRESTFSWPCKSQRATVWSTRTFYPHSLSLIKINTRTAWSPWSQGTQHDPFLCPPGHTLMTWSDSPF